VPVRECVTPAIKNTTPARRTFLSSSAGTSTTDGLRRGKVLSPGRGWSSVDSLALGWERWKGWGRRARSARGRIPQECAKERRRRCRRGGSRGSTSSKKSCGTRRGVGRMSGRRVALTRCRCHNRCQGQKRHIHLITTCASGV
jgi:hypothetical protein